MKISIINVPNLNLLGKREPDVYGSTSFEDFFEKMILSFPNIDFDYYQSNIACISAAVLGNHVASSGNATMIAIKIICAITNGKTPL